MFRLQARKVVHQMRGRRLVLSRSLNKQAVIQYVFDGLIYNRKSYLFVSKGSNEMALLFHREVCQTRKKLEQKHNLNKNLNYISFHLKILRIAQKTVRINTKISKTSYMILKFYHLINNKNQYRKANLTRNHHHHLQLC